MCVIEQEEAEVHTKVAAVLSRAPDILADLHGYQGAGEHIREVSVCVCVCVFVHKNNCVCLYSVYVAFFVCEFVCVDVRVCVYGMSECMNVYIQ